MRPLPAAAERRLQAAPLSLPNLLAGSDVVIALLPLTSGTRRVVGRSALRLMRPGAFLVNVGRGASCSAHGTGPVRAGDPPAGIA